MKTSEQIIVTNASEAITEIARIHKQHPEVMFFANRWLFWIEFEFSRGATVSMADYRIVAEAYPAGPGRWRLEIEEGVTL